MDTRRKYRAITLTIPPDLADEIKNARALGVELHLSETFVNAVRESLKEYEEFKAWRKLKKEKEVVPMG